MKVPKARKLKSGTWFLQLRLDGESIPVTGATESECTRAAELIKAEWRNGKKYNPAPEPGGMTLQECLDDYVKDCGPTLSPATERGYNSIKKNRFPNYRNKRLSEIKWQQMINEELSHVSEKTVYNCWGLVRPALKHAGFPIPKVKLAAVPVNEIAFLQPDEVLKFCKAIRGKKYEIPLLLLLHGLRQSELASLTWDDVDLEHGFITVHGATVRGPKGEVTKEQNKNQTSTRNVPIMIPQLQKAMEAFEPKEGKVSRQRPNSLLDDVKRACKRAGVTEVTCHGLRHSFAASICYRQGVNERQTMAWGGWADYHTMHKIYIRLTAVGESEALERVKGFFPDQKTENAN